MKKLFKYLGNSILLLVIITLSIGFLVDVTQIIPDNADVMVNDSLKVYYSPMYFYNTEVSGWEKLRLTKAIEAKSKNYSPDDNCKEQGYFIYEKSLFWYWLDSLGIIKQRKRWNPDGSWNW